MNRQKQHLVPSGADEDEDEDDEGDARDLISAKARYQQTSSTHTETEIHTTVQDQQRDSTHQAPLNGQRQLLAK